LKVSIVARRREVFGRRSNAGGGRGCVGLQEERFDCVARRGVWLRK
jgi:hypothetical protein